MWHACGFSTYYYECHNNQLDYYDIYYVDVVLILKHADIAYSTTKGEKDDL